MARPSSRNTTSRLRRALLTSSALSAAALALSGAAFANPTGGTFLDALMGQIQGCNGNATCEIDLFKSRSIIDWETFDINSGETTKFMFGGNDWIAFNRVLGEGSAKINGQLLGCLNTQCTSFGGNIWIYSADGFVIGKNASINTGGLLLTTSPMTTPTGKFTAPGSSQFDFGNSSAGAAIDVQSGASITGHGGTIALISQQVTTDAGSTITMEKGKGGGTASVLYGAASSYRVQFADDNGDFDLVDFQVPAGAAGGSASQTPLNIKGKTASAGNIYVAAVNQTQVAGAIINISGEMTATSVSSQGGDIVLSAGGGIVNQAAGPSAGAPAGVHLSGSLTAGNTVQIKASGDVKASGAIAAGNEVQIDSAGAINDTGTITTDTLTGSSVGGASFSGANVIKRLGDFKNTGTGDFSLTDKRSLDITGTLDNKVGNTTLHVDAGDGTAGNLSIDGTILANGHTLTTVAAGNIHESSGASIFAQTLTGSSMGGASFTGSNQIADLGAFTNSQSGDFTLNDGRALDVTGTLTNLAGNITLRTSDDLTIDALIDAGGNTLSLHSGGAISEGSLGEIDAGVLTGASAGEADFGAGRNSIAALADFTSGGDFSLTDATTLTITGTLDASGHAVTLVDTGGSIEASGGTIIAASLTGSAKGEADFSNPNNRIEMLDGFTADGFSLGDSRSLIVADAVDAGAGDLSFDVTGDLTLKANLTTAGTASLTASGGITQQAGIITAGVLTGSSGEATSLDGANDIASLAGFTSGGNFSLTDTASLTITGKLDATGHAVALFDTGGIDASHGAILAGSLTGSTGGDAIFSNGGNAIAKLAGFTSGGDFSLSDMNALVITGTLNASGHAVTLIDTGIGGTGVSIDASHGEIIAASLGGSAKGSAIFTGHGNNIDTLAGFKAGSGFQLVDAGPLTVMGNVDAGTGDLTLRTLMGDLTLDASLKAGSASGSQTISLISAGAISQQHGTITGGILTGSSRAATGLTGANKIGTLSDFTSGGDFSLTDATTLTITGTLDASGHAVTLVDTGGGIEASGGTIIAASLTGSAKGEADFSNLNNRIAVLDGFTADGFSLGDGRSLIVADAVDAGADDLSFNITGDLTLAANLTTAGTASLTASGGITQQAGIITAGVLTGSSGEATSLDGANAIKTLDGFISGGDFSLTDARSLTIAGTLEAAGHAVSLDVDGNIDAHNGVIEAASLAGSASGSADFSDPGNSIETLDGFTAGSGFALADAGPLTVTGDVDAGTGNLSLTTLSDLTLEANLVAGPASGSQTVALNAAGTITQNAGTITAGILTGGSGGATVLADGNEIGTLDSFTSGGDFSLTDASALAITGTLDASGHAVTLIDTGGGIDASGGTIVAASLTGSAMGDADFSNKANRIATLAGFTADGDFSLSDLNALVITGTLDASGHMVTLTDTGGGIDASGGIIEAGSLAGSSMGDAIFSNIGNMIAKLGDFANTHGSFVLNDAAALTITGTLNASGQAVSLYDTGTNDKGVSIDATNGAILAASLTGQSAGDADFSNPGNLIGTLGNFDTGGGDFTLITKTLPATIGNETENALVVAGYVNAGAGNVTIGATDGSIMIVNDPAFNFSGSINGGVVSLTAANDVLMGNENFISGLGGLQGTALTAYLNSQAQQDGTGTVFVTAHELDLSGAGRIVQQNTGAGLDHPDGILITLDDSDPGPAILISGSPTTVDLWGALVENGSKIPLRQVASSAAVQFGGDTKRSNSYRINGCIIQQTVACTIVQFNFDNIEPAKIADELQVKAADDDGDASEDDPTITGSGNPEIWGE